MPKSTIKNEHTQRLSAVRLHANRFDAQTQTDRKFNENVKRYTTVDTPSWKQNKK